MQAQRQYVSKLVAGLLFSTLAFATSNVYLSFQLGLEREKNLKQTTAPAPQRTLNPARRAQTLANSR